MESQDEIKFLAKMLFEKYNTLALDTNVAAEIVGKSAITLKLDRAESKGISYSRVGRFIKYSVTDIATYLVGQRQQVVGA